MRLEIEIIKSAFIGKSGLYDPCHKVIVKNGKSFTVVPRSDLKDSKKKGCRLISSIAILDSLYQVVKSSELKKNHQEIYTIASHFTEKRKVTNRNRKLSDRFKDTLVRIKNLFLGYGYNTSYDLANKVMSELRRDLKTYRKFNAEEFEKFTDAINAKDKDAIVGILKKGSKEKNISMVRSYLGLLAKYGSAEDDHLDFLLDQLKEKYGLEYQPYFARIYGRIRLHIDSMPIVIDYLVEKRKLQKEGIILCRSYGEFEQKLQEVEWKHEKNVSFIILNTDEVWQGWTHMNHVHVEVDKTGKVNIFVADTLPEKQWERQGKMISWNQMILNILDKKVPKSLGALTYFYSFNRQTNRTSCPIFALNDAVRIFKNKKNLKFIKNQRKPTDPAVIPFSTLPPDLMIPHQYHFHERDTFPNINELLTPSPGKNSVTLKEKLDTNMRRKEEEGKFREENNFTRKKELTYLGIVLEKIITSSNNRT
jgi:hypothetical protein